MANTEEFDDPFKSLSSSNLEDLTLGNHAGDGDDLDRGGGVVAHNGSAMMNRDERQPVASDDDDDPWAVLAAAAGEERVSDTLPSASTTAAATTATVLAHAEGESFPMPDTAATTSPATSSIIGQIRSLTANIIHDVDTKTGISTRARTVDDQLHISEKWVDFHSQVLVPTTTKTKEIVHEKIVPTVRERWGSIQQRTAETGVKERLTNVSSAVGQTWHETTSRVGHWREEQEMKRALANARNESLYGDAAGGVQPPSSLSHHFQQNNFDGAKEIVVEGWNWISQRIQETKLRQRQYHTPGSSGEGEPDNRTSKMRHLDSDGLPSSFRKD
jgi:hypothetical protein